MQSLVPGYWGARACTRSRQVRVRLPCLILGSNSQFANSNMGCVQVILVYLIAGCSPISCPIMSNSKCTPSNRYMVSKLAADSQRTETKKKNRFTQVGLNEITPSQICKICKSHSTSSRGIINILAMHAPRIRPQASLCEESINQPINKFNNPLLIQTW